MLRTQIPFMKTKIVLLLIFGTAVLVGCDKPDSSVPPSTVVASKPIPSTPTIKDYTFAQRTEFATTLEADRAEILRELDAIEVRIGRSSDAVKAEAKPRLQALRDQAAKLGTHLDAIQDATESTWDSVRTGSKEAYAQMKESFTQARQWVSEKVAP